MTFFGDCDGPVVYIFELLKIEKKEDLLVEFQKFRKFEFLNGNELPINCSCAHLSREAFSSKSNILYVGSKRRDIKNRIKEHLGFGHPKTYAMHLKFWVPSEVEINLHIIKTKDVKVLTEVEAALANELKPLIGKVEK